MRQPTGYKRGLRLRLGHNRSLRLLFLTLLFLPAAFAMPQLATAQTEEMSDMEMMEKVAALQKKLLSEKVSDRDEAQKELIALGPDALDFIEPPDDETESDARARILAIKVELEKQGAALATKFSTVTIVGKMTVEDALAKISELSGNDVSFIDEIPVSIAELEIELDHTDAEFWKVLTEVMDKGGLEVDPYGGDVGKMRLRPSELAVEIDPATGQPVVKEKPQVNIPRANSGVYDVQVTRVDSLRSLTAPAQNHSNINLLIRWEPRVKPISISFPMSEVKVVDEFDQPVAVMNEEAVMAGIVQPEINQVEFPLRLALVDRQIENLKSLKLRINTVLPGRVETFQFKKIGDVEKGEQQRKAGAVVTFGGIQKNEELFGVVVKLGFDEDNNALESHQAWAYRNECFLKDIEGNRHDYVTLETIQQDETQIGVRYYFTQDPANCTLHYKTPAAVVKVPVEVELKKIPMP